MAQTLPQIVKAAERLMAEIEMAVTRFSRAHRYTLGSDLRAGAMHASYAGHFSHANAWRLRHRFRTRYPWLRAALLHRRFDHRCGDRPILIAIPEVRP